MEGPNVDVPSTVITAEPSPPFIAEEIPLIVGEEYRTGLSESDLPPIPIELLQSRWLKISHPQGAAWLMRLNINHNGEPPGGVISENYHRLNKIPDRWGPLQVYNKGGKKSAVSREAEKELKRTSLRPKQPREKDFNGNGFHEAQTKYNELMKETVNDFKVGIEMAGTVSSGQGGEYIPPALSQGGLGHYIYHVSSHASGYLDPGPPKPDELINTGNSESTIYLYCGDGGLDSSFGGTHHSQGGLVPQHTHLTREQWVKKWVYGVISHGFNIDPEPSADFELWEREKIDRNKPVKEDTGGSSGSRRAGGNSKRKSKRRISKKRKSKRKSKKR
jgi:hypothetical protein